MVDKRIKFTPHDGETINKILELHDGGMRSKDIYKQSKDIFGFVIKQSTISNILARNGRNAKANTFRVKRRWRTGPDENKKNGKKLIPFSNETPPHEINYEM